MRVRIWPIRCLLLGLVPLCALSVWFANIAVRPIEFVNCNPESEAYYGKTIGKPGPLRLRKVVCTAFDPPGFDAQVSVVSPDERFVATSGSNRRLRRGSLVSGLPLAGWAATAPPDRWGPSISRHDAQFRWTSQPGVMWTAWHDLSLASWRPISQLQTFEWSPQHGLRRLPTISHSAGSLDALLWIDGQGHALAQFGAWGGFYEKPQRNSTPTLAFVHVPSGRVIDSVPFNTFASLDLTANAVPGMRIQDVSAVRLADGRLRALLRVQKWVLWTQGEPPQVLPDPYAGRQVALTLTPDGGSVLVDLPLLTKTSCGLMSPCKIGPPVTGPVLALHDLTDGRRLWLRNATAAYDWDHPRPAVSPDGRMAIAGLPSEGGEPRLGLVSTKDGRLLQTLPGPGGSYPTVGFSPSGDTAWAASPGVAFLYEVR